MTREDIKEKRKQKKMTGLSTGSLKALKRTEPHKTTNVPCQTVTYTQTLLLYWIKAKIMLSPSVN